MFPAAEEPVGADGVLFGAAEGAFGTVGAAAGAAFEVGAAAGVAVEVVLGAVAAAGAAFEVVAAASQWKGAKSAAACGSRHEGLRRA